VSPFTVTVIDQCVAALLGMLRLRVALYSDGMHCNRFAVWRKYCISFSRVVAPPGE